MIRKDLAGDELIGRKCRTVRPIRNQSGQGVTAETICVIKNVVKGYGITIQTEACPTCGQYAYITGVKRDELELID